MPYKDNLNKASSLKMELDGYRPLTPEMESRIMQKFRLDWNYHSSHIEGNQLTYGETKALLLFGQTAQAKPLKDHIEMTGHNEAIKSIEEVVSQKRPLNEVFIRELHKLILKEPYDVDAITPDGKPTKRTISVGQYKTVPNHVKTQTGEIFYFASPEETPAKMDDLLKWYKENITNPELHPVLFATEFHYRFICIHPFDDGNGRIARLLMNFILMQQGYPPAIIKTEEKDKYFAALQQADSGQLTYFFGYICEQVIRSLELMIKGAKGESIEEEDDLFKEIELWKKYTAMSAGEIIHRNDDLIYELYNNGIKELIDQFADKHKRFYELFHHASFSKYINNNGRGELNWFEDEIEKIALNPVSIFFNPGDAPEIYKPNDTFRKISIDISLQEYKFDEKKPFSVSSKLVFEFLPYTYIVVNASGGIEKKYGEFLNADERKAIIIDSIKAVFAEIKKKSE